VAHDLHFVVNETQIDEICTKKDALFQHLISSGLKPTNVNEGIKELLIDAKKHGLKLACASLSSNARLELERLGLFETFDYVTDYKNHIFDSFSEREKTLTSTTTLVLKSLKLDSSEVIGLEDDITGIVDYNRHGVYSVAISHFNPKIAAKANFAVDLPQQLNLEEIIFNYYQNDRSDF
jgi:beta-phosphoglucomutase